MRSGSYVAMIKYNCYSAGVYLSLDGRMYTSNNSYVVITDIGEGDNALLCITDLPICCNRANGRVAGEWVFPNGSLVRLRGDGDSFYRDRGSSVVRLNRRNNPVSPTGLYCCMVRDATSITQIVCANVGRYIIPY